MARNISIITIVKLDYNFRGYSRYSNIRTKQKKNGKKLVLLFTLGQNGNITQKTIKTCPRTN